MPVRIWVYPNTRRLRLNNYKEHDFVSIVEHTAIKRIEAEERYKQHLAEIEEMHRKGLERNSEKPERKKDIAR